MGTKNRLCRWLATLLISGASLALAHDPGLSTAAVKIFPDYMEAQATFARADIEALVPLDTNHDGKVSDKEWQQARPILEPLLRGTLIVRGNDGTTGMTEIGFQLDENDNFHVAGILRAEGAKLTVESSLIKRLARGHRQFISVLNNQGTPVGEALLSAENHALEINAEIAEEPGHMQSAATFGGFFLMGVEHILTGYDHLIFLFGLLIAISQFRATLWVITCFTLAHSVTLALAAFDVVRIPEHIVEPLIAVTIIYVGVENLLRLDNATGRWRLALIFGLVHGLGFATDLKEKVAGMVGEKIVLPLMSFNLGVELGQMAIASLVLPVIWCFRNEPVVIRVMVPACSVVVIVAGAWWLLERTLLS
jgi:hydrogenase/urease accessory protein HupE